MRIPAEMLAQLRFGRGVDNRRYKAAGFEYGYTSREAVMALAEHMRLHPLLHSSAEPYRYEREVEEFLRWSPNVRNGSRHAAIAARQGEGAGLAAGPPVDRYDDLRPDEIVSLISSLEPEALQALRDYENGRHARAAVIGAIDSALARSQASERGRLARRRSQAGLQPELGPGNSRVTSLHSMGLPVCVAPHPWDRSHSSS